MKTYAKSSSLEFATWPDPISPPSSGVSGSGLDHCFPLNVVKLFASRGILRYDKSTPGSK